MKLKAALASITLAAAMSAAPVIVSASEPSDTIKTVSGDFDEVFGDLQDVVINRGLVIDYVGHVDKMLERTAEAAKSSGSSSGVAPYLNARYMQFCSSAPTHEAVEADAQNIAMCPYLVFAYETKADAGRISVGYRQISLSSSAASQAAQAKVHGLLDAIINDAVGQNQ